MNLNDFAQEVHRNAVAHGFWVGEPDITETVALIHSEWSEALEEYRAGRPMVWYRCGHTAMDKICNYSNDGCDLHGTDDCERMRFKKPEGIAVELIDGCIRILDLFGRRGRRCIFSSVADLIEVIRIKNPELSKDTPLPRIVYTLHTLTAGSYKNLGETTALALLEAAIGVVFFWVSENGIDPEALMMQKHEFNKGRPYKHGKKC